MITNGKIEHITGVILAGGQSRRLGYPKAFAEVGGKPLIQRVIGCLKTVFTELLLVTARPQPETDGLGISVACDLFPAAGPLGGIYTALKSCRKPVFCCACDMPFLDPAVIRAMADNFDDLDVLVPYVDGREHPLHAFYSPACLEHIYRTLEAGERRVASFFPGVRTGSFTESQYPDAEALRLAMFNINTQAELIWAQKTANESLIRKN